MSFLVQTSTLPGALEVVDTDDLRALRVTESTARGALRVRQSTRPGALRVRGLFSPSQLPGLAAWYDAADSNTVLTTVGPDVPATDGQTVRRWLDKSGNNRHLEQETLAAQPSLSVGNGIAAAGAAYMTANWPAINQPFSIVFAASGANTGANNGYIFESNGGGNQAVYGLNYATQGFFGRFATFPVDGSWILPAAINERAVLGFLANGASSIQRKNLTTTKTNNTGTQVFSAAEVSFFSRNLTNAYAAKLTGQISEFFICAGDIGQANMTRAIQYMGRKWGVAV